MHDIDLFWAGVLHAVLPEDTKGITLNSTTSKLASHAIWLKNPSSSVCVLPHFKTSNYQDESEVEFLEEFDETHDSDDPLDCDTVSYRPGEVEGPPRDVKPSAAELRAFTAVAKLEGGVATAHDLDKVGQPVGSAAAQVFSLAPETMVVLRPEPDQGEEESELDVDGDDSDKGSANACEFCGKVFSRAVQRLRHNCTRTFTCSSCGWKGTSSDALLRHEAELHHAKRSHPCEECGTRCLSAAALISHRRVHAKGKTTCACDKCGANFTTTLSLKRHERDCLAAQQQQSAGAVDVKPLLKRPKVLADRFVCRVCCASFARKGNILRHTQIAHTLKFPHKCRTCVSSFKTRKALSKHLKVHSQERSFSCSECGLSFDHRSQLVHHLKEHMGVSAPLVHAIKKELGVSDERRRSTRRKSNSNVALVDVKVQLTRLVENA